MNPPLQPAAETGRARALFAASSPLSPDIHRFGADDDPHLLVVDGDRVFRVDAATGARLRAAESGGDPAAVGLLLDELGLRGAPFIVGGLPAAPPVRALSLAVAQKCNLGCTYCYAQQGDFGGAAKSMDAVTALGAVELMLRGAGPGERFNLAFLGGEPLANREVVRAATERAAELAAARGAAVTFSITTNGTLLRDDDAELFERHGFAVTISLDGPRAVHDRLRPFKSGRGSYDAVMARVLPLLSRQRRMQVSARVTVTPHNLGLRATLDELTGLGFHSVGFSPLLSSPAGAGEMGAAELEVMLAQMVACGEELERRIAAGERYPFANGVNALREIHKGTHRPYPCGAGAGYLGVSADGDLAACHRFVNDPAGALGDLDGGVDLARQAAWLAERHVDRQEPCRRCWARYLCGGGCHHEVIHRGRPACDYIRGWLHYCLEAYARLVARRPDWFTATPP